MTKANLDGEWRDSLVETIVSITNTEIDMDAVADFLAWRDADGLEGEEDEQSPSNNIFRYPTDAQVAAIRVGSIHSVKGETHTATLDLETNFYAHHLKTLRGLLTGDKAGGAGESAAVLSRLRLPSVATSTPSHLLCLAMREDVPSNGDFEKLSGRGWCIGT